MLVPKKYIFPELHNLCGGVNHPFYERVVPKVGLENALIWPTKLGQISAGYNWRTFEGGAWRTELKNSEKLLEPELLCGKSPFASLPYVSFLKSLNNVIEDCFSTGRVNSDWVEETLKFHVTLEHISECLFWIVFWTGRRVNPQEFL